MKSISSHLKNLGHNPSEEGFDILFMYEICIFDMRKELQNKLKRLQVSVLYLFGSGALGKRTRSSDIDIGVVFKQIQPVGDTRVLYNTLSGIFSGMYRISKIDIVFLQTALLSLQYSAIKEGKILFEEDPLVTADYEHGVINQYLDFKPVLDFF